MNEEERIVKENAEANNPIPGPVGQNEAGVNNPNPDGVSVPAGSGEAVGPEVTETAGPDGQTRDVEEMGDQILGLATDIDDHEAQPETPSDDGSIEGEVSENNGEKPAEDEDSVVKPSPVGMKKRQMTDQERRDHRDEDQRMLKRLKRKTDMDVELSVDDLKYLYETGARLSLYPRDYEDTVKSIREGRDFVSDMSQIYGTSDHNQIVDHLIESDLIGILSQNFDKFEGVDPNATAIRIIGLGRSQAFDFASQLYLGTFGPLNADVAKQLIKAHQVTSLMLDFENFEGIDPREIADLLLETGQGSTLVHQLHKFEGLDHADFADKLIKSGEGNFVLTIMDELKGVDRAKIADQLIESGLASSLAWHLDQFEGVVDHAKLASQLLESGAYSSLVENLGNFKDIDQQNIVKCLVENAQDLLLVKNISKFNEVDPNQIAQQLIDLGEGELVVSHLLDAEGIDQNQVIGQLISTGAAKSVANRLDMLRGDGVDYNEIARQLINSGNGGILAQNIARFENLDVNQLALDLIAAGEVEKLSIGISNRSTFGKRSFSSQVAEILIKAGRARLVLANQHQFNGLDKSFKKRMKKQYDISKRSWDAW